MSFISALFILHSFFEIMSAVVSAQWRQNQRSHVPIWLNDNDVTKLASLTDIRSIRSLLQPIMVERQVGTKKHDEIAAYLKQKCDEFGFYTEWDSFYADTPLGTKSFHNLIATYDPLIHRRLVLACHYDSKIFEGQIFIGATDSALPCALLLDLARTLGPLLAQRTERQITLQLLFFDGEEAFHDWTPTDSIYGARHLADNWEKRWYPTTSGSAFELSREIDRAGAKKPTIMNTFGHGASLIYETLPEIELRLRSMRLMKPIDQIFHPGSRLQAVEDDHIPFLQRGVPIIHLIPVPFPPFWHTPGDNQKVLDNDTIANLAGILRIFVAQYLGIHARP